MKKIILLGHTSNLCKDIFSCINNYEFIKTNIRDIYNLNFKCETIINFASANPLSQDNNNFYLQNIKIANDIMKLSTIVKANKIINISAMSIFNGVSCEQINRSTNPVPVDEYSKSKFEMENIFNRSDIESVINIRLPGVEIPQNPNTLFSRFRDAIIKSETVHYYNGDKYTNNVINLKNIYGFIEAILNRNDMTRINYNLGSNKPMKIKEVIEQMRIKYSSNSKLIEFESSINSFNIDLSEELKIFKLSDTYEYI
jgi:dTDP-4-dehydrorhamnose reductase